jgi:nitrogen fixation NifU-like protein
VKEEPLHREILEEHARNPRFESELDDHTHQAVFQSLKTGNTCTISLKVKRDVIIAMGLEIQGSALANASASLLYSEILSQTTDQVKELILCLSQLLELGEPADLRGDMCVYKSIARFPERHDCALLAWRALARALSG